MLTRDQGDKMAAMARRNGQSGLEAALTQLVQNQAALIAQHTLFVSHLDEDRRRFSRIERELDEIKSLLLQHDEILKNHDRILKEIPEAIKMLRDLPEVIRQKIGFKFN